MQRAEFDKFADEYYQQHVRNIAVTGESPEYFSEYKIADVADVAAARGVAVDRILDFGSGIGNSIPYFRKYFPQATLSCADVSTRSIDLARSRYPGSECHVAIVDRAIPVADAQHDLVFSACVFHHIPHDEHRLWLEEMHRACRPGGLLAIFEHNPFNPLTRRAVDTCPFDENALLIRPGAFRRLVTEAGWRDVEVHYRIFFPRALARLRPLERWLRRVMVGAQYCVIAVRP